MPNHGKGLEGLGIFWSVIQVRRQDTQKACLVVASVVKLLLMLHKNGHGLRGSCSLMLTKDGHDAA